MAITVGSDPELFVLKNNKIVSAIGMVGGTKTAPRCLGDGFYIQEDNVAVEFNIPPANTRDEFISNILYGIQLCNNELPNGAITVPLTSHQFKMSQLKNPKANEFGCSSDRNAWEGGVHNPKPGIPTDGLRCTGGHVAIGFPFDNCDERDVLANVIVQWMDILAAVPSVELDPDRRRRELYGQAGSYRLPVFGVEYRTLSSFWLKSPELIGWVYDCAIKATTLALAGETPDSQDKDLIIKTFILILFSNLILIILPIFSKILIRCFNLLLE